MICEVPVKFPYYKVFSRVTALLYSIVTCVSRSTQMRGVVSYPRFLKPFPLLLGVPTLSMGQHRLSSSPIFRIFFSPFSAVERCVQLPPKPHLQYSHWMPLFSLRRHELPADCLLKLKLLFLEVVPVILGSIKVGKQRNANIKNKRCIQTIDASVLRQLPVEKLSTELG